VVVLFELECFRSPLMRFVSSADARSTIVFCVDIFIGRLRLKVFLLLPFSLWY
jgi:hypothetical protein